MVGCCGSFSNLSLAAVFVQVESLGASEIGSAENSADVRPQSRDYDPEATDIFVNPAPVQGSSSTISVKEENLSAPGGPYQGRATFDVRLIIDPPGFANTVYRHWDDVSFVAGGTETLSLEHTFTRPGDHELTAEVYNNGGLANGWDSDAMFSGATSILSNSCIQWHPLPTDDVLPTAIDLTVEGLRAYPITRRL